MKTEKLKTEEELKSLKEILEDIDVTIDHEKEGENEPLAILCEI